MHMDMGHGDMGHGDMGHGDMDMGGKCSMNVSYSLGLALFVVYLMLISNVDAVQLVLREFVHCLPQLAYHRSLLLPLVPHRYRYPCCGLRGNTISNS